MNVGHVYVLAFDNGTVKVGRTQNAAQRLNAHKSSARGFGLTVADEWVSPIHVGWRANEDALKSIAAELGGTPTSSEYFSGVDFADVVERAHGLTFATPDDDAAAAEPVAEPQPDAENLDQVDEEFLPVPRTAREAAIRDAAAEWATTVLASELNMARVLLDYGGTPSDMRAIERAIRPAKGSGRIGDIMQLILDREREVGEHYDTVLAIQRRLTGSAD